MKTQKKKAKCLFSMNILTNNSSSDEGQPSKVKVTSESGQVIDKKSLALNLLSLFHTSELFQDLYAATPLWPMILHKMLYLKPGKRIKVINLAQI